MSNYTKYPRTFHLPYSFGRTSDDKVLKTDDQFIGKHVVITEKMDGENTTLYRNYLHARSIDGRHHPSRDWVKQFHSTFSHLMPESFRICGENVYAKHSIEYTNLESYFYGFSIWEGDMCLSWNDTLEYLEIFGVTPVPVLYQGIYEGPETASKLIQSMNLNTQEGFVIRNAESFHIDDFSKNVAKFVRQSHVQTDEHWMNAAIVPNKLRSTE